MKLSTFIGTLILTAPALAIVDKFTPENTDWDKFPTHNDILYQKTANPSQELIVHAKNQGIDNITSVEVLGIGLAIGWAWANPFNAALGLAGVGGAINGCIADLTEVRNAFFCGLGIASTIAGFGLHRSASKGIAKVASRIWGENRWDPNMGGIELNDVDVFDRFISSRSLLSRSLDDSEHDAQNAHDYLTHLMLKSAGFEEHEFLGYEPENHQLHKRSGGLHPLVPRFGFTHPVHGPMVVSTKDTSNTTHITLAYGGHHSFKRNVEFQEERLQSDLMEGRFDQEASSADPNDIQADAKDAFPTLESSVECFVNAEGDTQWRGNSALNLQMYDTTNRATFGFGSIGVFADHSTDDDLATFEPSGLPLQGGMNC